MKREAYKNAQKEQRPDSKYAPHIKIANVNGAGQFFFFYEQVGDQKPAQHKKEIHTEIAILK